MKILLPLLMIISLSNTSLFSQVDPPVSQGSPTGTITDRYGKHEKAICIRINGRRHVNEPETCQLPSFVHMVSNINSDCEHIPEKIAMSIEGQYSASGIISTENNKIDAVIDFGEIDVDCTEGEDRIFVNFKLCISEIDGEFLDADCLFPNQSLNPLPTDHQGGKLEDTEYHPPVWSFENGLHCTDLTLDLCCDSEENNEGHGRIITDPATNNDKVGIMLRSGADVPTINLYPNPVNNLLNINIPELNQVNIFDARNRLISSKLLAGQNTIDVSGYENGIYFITFQNNTTRVVKKFLKI